MTYELDDSLPLVLLIGTLDSEGIKSTIKASGRQFKIKRIDSSRENWESINALFNQHKIRCALLKLTATTYGLLAKQEYAPTRDKLLDNMGQTPHVIFVHEELWLNPSAESTSDDASASLTDDTIDHDSSEPWDASVHSEIDPEAEEMEDWPFFNTISADVHKTVNDLLIARGLNVLPYKRNAELTVMASSFITDAEGGLLFRIYIPTGRIWANETDRLLQLFRDYLTRIGHSSVRLDQRRTERGVVYEFFGAPGNDTTPSTISESSLATKFREFSELMDLCVSDLPRAEALLLAKNIDAREVTVLLARYAKEARRLQVDVKHEWEQKSLAIRQRCESELVDLLPAGFAVADIGRLVDSTIPQASGLKSILMDNQRMLQVSAEAGSTVTLNIDPKIVNAVNSIVAHEIGGDAHLGEMDHKLLQLIREHAGDRAPELTSAVHELADGSTPPPDRLMARQRLKAFLQYVGGKIGDIGFGLLQTYLEKKIGL